MNSSNFWILILVICNYVQIKNIHNNVTLLYHTIAKWKYFEIHVIELLMRGVIETLINTSALNESQSFSEDTKRAGRYSEVTLSILLIIMQGLTTSPCCVFG